MTWKVLLNEEPSDMACLLTLRGQIKDVIISWTCKWIVV